MTNRLTLAGVTNRQPKSLIGWGVSNLLPPKLSKSLSFTYDYKKGYYLGITQLVLLQSCKGRYFREGALKLGLWHLRKLKKSTHLVLMAFPSLRILILILNEPTSALQ